MALPILMGLGKPKIPTIAFVVAGMLNLGLSIALAGPFGLAGVAIGTAIPNVLFAILVLVVACRELELSVAHYLAYVVPRATAGALPTLALLLWFRLGLDVQTFPGMVAAGVGMVVLFGMTWIFFVYRKDPYVDVQAASGSPCAHGARHDAQTDRRRAHGSHPRRESPHPPPPPR